MFSLDNAEGVRFLIRSRIFDDVEIRDLAGDDNHFAAIIASAPGARRSSRPGVGARRVASPAQAGALAAHT